MTVAAALPAVPEVAAFACAPLACRLTVEACAKRHREARRPVPGRWNTPGLRATSCIDCDVGKAHARGETPERWPDGSPIVRVGIAPRAPLSAVPTTHEERMAAKQITHDGRTQTFAEWGAELGMSGAAIRQRIERGMSVAEALTTPKQCSEFSGGSGNGQLYKLGDREMTLAAWVDEPDVAALGLSVETIRKRIKREGMEFAKAISQPLRRPGPVAAGVVDRARSAPPRPRSSRVVAAVSQPTASPAVTPLDGVALLASCGVPHELVGQVPRGRLVLLLDEVVG